MSKYIKWLNRYQVSLFPISLDDYISENNEVRVIDAFIESLNLELLGFKNTTPKKFGAPSYDPRDLLKRTHDASYLLLKGIDKIEGELTLSVLGYNIHRLIKIIGISELIEYLNTKKKALYA